MPKSQQTLSPVAALAHYWICLAQRETNRTGERQRPIDLQRERVREIERVERKRKTNVVCDYWVIMTAVGWDCGYELCH